MYVLYMWLTNLENHPQRKWKVDTQNPPDHSNMEGWPHSEENGRSWKGTLHGRYWIPWSYMPNWRSSKQPPKEMEDCSLHKVFRIIQIWKVGHTQRKWKVSNLEHCRECTKYHESYTPDWRLSKMTIKGPLWSWILWQ